MYCLHLWLPRLLFLVVAQNFCQFTEWTCVTQLWSSHTRTTSQVIPHSHAVLIPQNKKCLFSLETGSNTSLILWGKLQATPDHEKKSPALIVFSLWTWAELCSTHPSRSLHCGNIIWELRAIWEEDGLPCWRHTCLNEGALHHQRRAGTDTSVFHPERSSPSCLLALG